MHGLYRRCLLSLLVIVSMSLAACAPRVAAVRTVPGQHEAGRREPLLSPDQEKALAEHVPFGLPQLAPGYPHGITHLVVHEGYVLEHSATNKIPLWVAEHVNEKQLRGMLFQHKPLRPDPALPVGARAEVTDYANSGYNAGLMAPGEYQTWTRHLRDERFFLSNAAPQHPQLDMRLWSEIEDQMRFWVWQRSEGYVITGSFFYDPAEEDPATADGLIQFERIGLNSVAVPTHFYKIFLGKTPEGEWQAIAFVVSNQQHLPPFYLPGYITSIDWIEAQAGLDFFPELDAATQQRLEAEPASLVDF